MVLQLQGFNKSLWNYFFGEQRSFVVTIEVKASITNLQNQKISFHNDLKSCSCEVTNFFQYKKKSQIFQDNYIWEFENSLLREFVDCQKHLKK